MAFTDGFNAPPDDDDPRLPDPTVSAAPVTLAPDPTQAAPVVAYQQPPNPVLNSSSGLIKGVTRRTAKQYNESAPAPASAQMLPNGQIINTGQSAAAPFDPSATNMAPAASVVPAASTPDPTASVAPAATTAFTAGFDADGGQPSAPGRPTLAAAPTERATPFAPPTSSTDDIDPDSAVDLGLPSSSGSTAVAPAATASAAPATPKPATIPAPDAFLAPSTSSTNAGGNGVDRDLNAMLGGGDPDADDKAQYARDNAASLKAFKAQGGATTIAPTGQEVPQYDGNSGLMFKPATLNPVTQLDNGRFYRVDRDATGNQNYFGIEDEGTEGQDFLVDPATGEKYVVTPTAAAGQSKRVVIGQNHYIPAANTIKALAQSHQDDAQQASQAVAQAQEGVIPNRQIDPAMKLGE